MFIKAYASGGAGTGLARTINRQLGIGSTNPQSRFYRSTGLSGLGGNRRTRGRLAPIRPVTRGR